MIMILINNVIFPAENETIVVAGFRYGVCMYVLFQRTSDRSERKRHRLRDEQLHRSICLLKDQGYKNDTENILVLRRYGFDVPKSLNRLKRKYAAA